MGTRCVMKIMGEIWCLLVFIYLITGYFFHRRHIITFCGFLPLSKNHSRDPFFDGSGGDVKSGVKYLVAWTSSIAYSGTRWHQR